MKVTNSNMTMNYKGLFVLLASLLLVLLTSCPVKSSLKTLAGIPVKTENQLPQGKNTFSTHTGNSCSVLSATEVQHVQPVQKSMNDLLPIIVFTAAFLFINAYPAAIKERKHPVYSRSSKISNAIPLFLAYRKLILHFTF